MIARDILAIQAAGVGIEREFSIARNFNADNRRYSPAVLRALMMCNHFQNEEVRETKRDFFIRLREEEITDEELLAEQEQDALATEQVLLGLRTIYISDTDERDESEQEDDNNEYNDEQEVIIGQTYQKATAKGKEPATRSTSAAKGSKTSKRAKK